jgi:hypothetical protein
VYQNGGEVVPYQEGLSELSLSLLSGGGGCSERPGAVKGAPVLGAAKRTLDGEDRSKMIVEEGKAAAKDWRKVVRHFGTLARRL